MKSILFSHLWAPVAQSGCLQSEEQVTVIVTSGQKQAHHSMFALCLICLGRVTTNSREVEKKITDVCCVMSYPLLGVFVVTRA